MHAGPSSRKRASQKAYVSHLARKNDSCDFCAFTKDSDQVVRSFRHFWIVENIFGYDEWDDNHVVEHLMIVPKRHVVSLGELSPKEAESFAKVLGTYESKGYSIYARAAQNIAKSVLHQHTHLIKLGSTRKKFKLYVRKPHLLISK